MKMNVNISQWDNPGHTIEFIKQICKEVDKKRHRRRRTVLKEALAESRDKVLCRATSRESSTSNIHNITATSTCTSNSAASNTAATTAASNPNNGVYINTFPQLPSSNLSALHENENENAHANATKNTNVKIQPAINSTNTIHPTATNSSNYNSNYNSNSNNNNNLNEPSITIKYHQHKKFKITHTLPKLHIEGSHIKRPESTATIFLKKHYAVDDVKELTFIPYFGDNDTDQNIEDIKDLFNLERREKMVQYGPEYVQEEVNDSIKDVLELLFHHVIVDTIDDDNAISKRNGRGMRSSTSKHTIMNTNNSKRRCLIWNKQRKNRNQKYDHKYDHTQGGYSHHLNDWNSKNNNHNTKNNTNTNNTKLIISGLCRQIANIKGVERHKVDDIYKRYFLSSINKMMDEKTTKIINDDDNNNDDNNNDDDSHSNDDDSDNDDHVDDDDESKSKNREYQHKHQHQHQHSNTINEYDKEGKIRNIRNDNALKTRNSDVSFVHYEKDKHHISNGKKSTQHQKQQHKQHQKQQQQKSKVTRYEDAMDSFRTLFCRQCFVYDCNIHGNLPQPNLKLQTELAIQKELEEERETNNANNINNGNRNGNGNGINLKRKYIDPQQSLFNMTPLSPFEHCLPCNEKNSQKHKEYESSDDDANDNSATICTSNNDKEEKGNLEQQQQQLTPIQKVICEHAYQVFRGDIQKISIAFNKRTTNQTTIKKYIDQTNITLHDNVLDQINNAKKKHQRISEPRKKKMKSSDYYNHVWLKRVQNAEIHPAFFPCTHDLPCSDETCSCVQNAFFCTKHCVWGDKSRNMFRGCVCKNGQCSTNCCPCFAAQRECDPDLCKSCQSCTEPANTQATTQRCRNDNISMRRHSHLLLAESSVSNAGWGIYNKSFLKKGTFVHEYVGELISQEEAERRGVLYDKMNRSYLFNLTSDTVIDASRKGNKMKFANHSANKPNCYAKILTVNGDNRVGLFAREDIEPQTELLFDYAYDLCMSNDLIEKSAINFEWMNSSKIKSMGKKIPKKKHA